jgi:hypothetical protein
MATLFYMPPIVQHATEECTHMHHSCHMVLKGQQLCTWIDARVTLLLSFEYCKPPTTMSLAQYMHILGTNPTLVNHLNINTLIIFHCLIQYLQHAIAWNCSEDLPPNNNKHKDKGEARVPEGRTEVYAK